MDGSTEFEDIESFIDLLYGSNEDPRLLGGTDHGDLTAIMATPTAGQDYKMSSS
jgi:hypothetical protein